MLYFVDSRRTVITSERLGCTGYLLVDGLNAITGYD
jgi:hypothetical protein